MSFPRSASPGIPHSPLNVNAEHLPESVITHHPPTNANSPHLSTTNGNTGNHPNNINTPHSAANVLVDIDIENHPARVNIQTDENIQPVSAQQQMIDVETVHVMSDDGKLSIKIHTQALPT